MPPFSWIIRLLISVLVTLGCGFVTAADASTLRVLTHYGHQAEATGEQAWLAEQIETFRKQTGDDIQLVTVPFGSLGERWLEDHQKGQEPDVIVGVPGDFLGPLVRAGVVEPWEP